MYFIYIFFKFRFSYSSLNQHENARQSYLKAIQLEPDNESYKNNLKLANESLARGKVDYVLKM